MRDNYNSFHLKDSKGSIARDNRHDTGLNGMVATARHEASKIGIDIIREGGNAIDAAVAVGFALGVCEPNASGIGGGGFMTIHLAETGKNTFIDFRENAPESADPSMWPVDEKGEITDNAKSQGGLSVCIPGEVAGLLFALEKYGTFSIEKIMAPAIRLAREGFEITETLHRDLTECADKLNQFREPGNPYIGKYEIGQMLRNPHLADTLECIAERGEEAFYGGKIGAKMVDSVNRHSGHMTLRDFRGYSVRELEPLKGSYRGYEILSSPLPSSGGTHILQILNIMENFDMESLEVNSADYIHILAEAVKMSFADRKTYMGDPDFARVPIGGITSKKYAEELSGKIDMERAKSYEEDDPFRHEPKDTSHYSIADHDGNLVSVTKTISAFFGSGIVPENTGLVLNCQMRGFALGHGKANSVGPGKKPLSSMSPTIVLKEGEAFAVLGSPGGNRIIPTVAQVISRLIDHNHSIRKAVESPRISDDTDSVLFYEGRIGQPVIEVLKARGHQVSRLSDYDRKVGGVQGILFGDDGRISGTGDPRRDGVAIGF